MKIVAEDLGISKNYEFRNNSRTRQSLGADTNFEYTQNKCKKLCKQRK